MDEQLVRECLRMFSKRAEDHKERAAYFRHKGEIYLRALEDGTTTAYENAAIMLEYAIEGNAECLKQFDYFGESEG